jgi:hypothetical protein
MITEYILPLSPSIPSYDFIATIEGRALAFNVRWNQREPSSNPVGAGAWFMDIAEIDATPIMTGIKIVLGAFLGRESTHIIFKRGVFIAYDTSSNQQDAGYDDLGTRVMVKYIPAIDWLRRLTQETL